MDIKIGMQDCREDLSGFPEIIQQIANAMLGGVTLPQLQNNIYMFPGYTQLLMYAVRRRPGDPM